MTRDREVRRSAVKIGARHPETVGGMAHSELAQPEIPSCDAAHDMLRAIFKGAFPALFGAIEAELDRSFSDDDNDADEPPALERFATALQADLDGLLRYQGRLAALKKRTDPEAFLMKALDLTVIPPTMIADIETARSLVARGTLTKHGPKSGH